MVDVRDAELTQALLEVSELVLRSNTNIVGELRVKMLSRLDGYRALNERRIRRMRLLKSEGDALWRQLVFFEQQATDEDFKYLADTLKRNVALEHKRMIVSILYRLTQ